MTSFCNLRAWVYDKVSEQVVFQIVTLSRNPRRQQLIVDALVDPQQGTAVHMCGRRSVKMQGCCQLEVRRR